MKIAIDGPAGSGKSTIAKILAERLGFQYLDTGALYRGVTFLLLSKGIDPSMEQEVVSLLEGAVFTFNDEGLVLDGRSIEREIRRNQISNHVSDVAAYPYIRRKLTDIERRIAEQTANVILDGRDIGTVVLPDAEVKIFLTASPEVRGQRRYMQLIDRGENVDLNLLIKEIRERDQKDMNRTTDPLKKADDAWEIVTDSLGIPEVVDNILEIVNNTL